MTWSTLMYWGRPESRPSEPGDVGILHAQVAQAAKQANAYDLAEEFFNNAIASAEHLGYRFGELNRKVGLLTVLDKIPERAADAEACARELRAELDRDDTSTITRLVVNRCLGTRKPDAVVCALGNSSAKRFPSSNARTIGAHPAACTVTMRGRFESIQPICSISSKAFHIPIKPVPPPVG